MRGICHGLGRGTDEALEETADVRDIAGNSYQTASQDQLEQCEETLST